MKANERQIDNLVSLLDGYVAEGGHHPVSYTHLDVYKRQRFSRGIGFSQWLICFASLVLMIFTI